ncbi:hypothetical protein L249_1236 [Ophiocordyceps polyrhachis-furcata BCC 54312]|uniref:Uncharacterized protein n=1 Tax=Ophiocordyceps polyrhachis-furcata BCC 54312 TaxID=1330021 RepID=A0A367LDY9_9HYPO|nr:hypothetical protein L249_1236 [Ophiocordyceps polyrhachis-furcata BCC 54312]
MDGLMDGDWRGDYIGGASAAKAGLERVKGSKGRRRTQGAGRIQALRPAIWGYMPSQSHVATQGPQAPQQFALPR